MKKVPLKKDVVVYTISHLVYQKKIIQMDKSFIFLDISQQKAANLWFRNNNHSDPNGIASTPRMRGAPLF